MMFFNGSLSIVFFSCLFMVIIITNQGENMNICDWIRCANGGICEKAENSTIGYKCRCQFGFTGLLCEDRVNITTCVKNPCLNDGNCTITNDHLIICKCSKQYTGVRCETLL